MIEEATVDAYDESEQATGWFTMFEEHLALPFDTEVLGVRVAVEEIDLIVAVCRRGKVRQSIAITDLPLRRRGHAALSGSRRTANGAVDGEAGVSDLTRREAEFLLYQTEDGRTRVEVRFDGETAWLSLGQMAELFQRDKSVISRHVKNVFDEDELTRCTA